MASTTTFLLEYTQQWKSWQCQKLHALCLAAKISLHGRLHQNYHTFSLKTRVCRKCYLLFNSKYTRRELSSLVMTILIHTQEAGVQVMECDLPVAVVSVSPSVAMTSNNTTLSWNAHETSPYNDTLPTGCERCMHDELMRSQPPTLVIVLSPRLLTVIS